MVSGVDHETPHVTGYACAYDTGSRRRPPYPSKGSRNTSPTVAVVAIAAAKSGCPEARTKVNVASTIELIGPFKTATVAPASPNHMPEYEVFDGSALTYAPLELPIEVSDWILAGPPGVAEAFVEGYCTDTVTGTKLDAGGPQISTRERRAPPKRDSAAKVVSATLMRPRIS